MGKQQVMGMGMGMGRVMGMEREMEMGRVMGQPQGVVGSLPLQVGVGMGRPRSAQGVVERR
jgi:hypothetical protein